MQKIYLAKPGGQKEGPYTLEQINRDLATKRYGDAELWAWHEGLPSWMPLYSLPGVSTAVAAPAAEPQPVAPKTEPKAAPEVEAQRAAPKAEAVRKPEAPKAATAATAARMEAANAPVFVAKPAGPKPPARTPLAEPEPGAQKAAAPPSMSSGKPFSALEQIFILTTGEGPSAFRSDVTTGMLVEAVGEPLDHIRAKAPVDVVGRADPAVLKTISAGSIPDSAWRVLSSIKPAVVQQAQAGAYHLCVRTFPVGSNETAVLFLLYNKQKL